MAKIICISAQKPSSKQSLFAAYLAIVLSEHNKTALVNCALKTRLLETFIAKRFHFNLKYRQNLPVPTYTTYKKEIFNDFDFLVIDTVNTTLMSEADIVINLVENTKIFEDLTNQQSSLLTAVWEAKKARAATGKNAFSHIVIPFSCLSDQALLELRKASSFKGFCVSPVFKESDIFEQSLENGVTVLDKNIDFFKKDFSEEDFFARRNLKQIFEFILSEK